ncbi:hypothetical protein B4135_3576 [Caldibacillus debilis]|uniref:Uncharacterized protein n=1 Tax=Caldibacillus debilis TaxID=301148 RepID=A0A150LDI6_9BACI|nr:hypothetical protein B4135_3576 [Caldibacillus debilis]
MGRRRNFAGTKEKIVKHPRRSSELNAGGAYAKNCSDLGMQ